MGLDDIKDIHEVAFFSDGNLILIGDIDFLKLSAIRYFWDKSVFFGKDIIDIDGEAIIELMRITNEEDDFRCNSYHVKLSGNGIEVSPHELYFPHEDIVNQLEPIDANDLPIPLPF